jgi:glycerol-3-phosphate cytidylyltransferase
VSKLGVIAGFFDLLHPGHLHALEYTKDYCDKLIVALNTDPTKDNPLKNKPIQTVMERSYQLDKCRFVDSIMCYESEQDLENFYKLLYRQHENIDLVVFVGEDHFGLTVTGEKFFDECGIEVIYIPRQHNFSSTALRNRMGIQEIRAIGIGAC